MQPFRASILASLVVLLAALAGLTACGSSGAGTAPSSSTPAAAGPAARPSTTAHRLLRTPPTGAPRSGSCFTTSITVGRAGVFRCFVGNAILDPCYSTGARAVACYADPWTKPVGVRLTKPLPAGPPTPVHRPWAIVLAGQIQCLATTGVVPVVHGTPLTYSCLDGGAAALTGSATAALRAALYRPTATAALQPTTVTDVWSG